MSIAMKQDIKRWTAKRKSALVLDIIQGVIPPQIRSDSG